MYPFQCRDYQRGGDAIPYSPQHRAFEGGDGTMLAPSDGGRNRTHSRFDRTAFRVDLTLLSSAMTSPRLEFNIARVGLLLMTPERKR